MTNAGYIETQKRLEKVEYKMFGAEQDIRQLSDVLYLKYRSEKSSHLVRLWLLIASHPKMK